jgi:hypothetical protein
MNLDRIHNTELVAARVKLDTLVSRRLMWMVTPILTCARTAANGFTYHNPKELSNEDTVSRIRR